jgi:hypothetical protein
MEIKRYNHPFVFYGVAILALILPNKVLRDELKSASKLSPSL